MPRPSASAKRQQAARDSRHENGLVGPGKRIPKQKSQSHLTGSPSAKSPSPCFPSHASDNVPPVPVPSTPPQHSNNGLGNANAYAGNNNNNNNDNDNMTNESLRRGSLGAYSESSSSSDYLDGQETHRRIDVNATKNSNVHRDPGPFDFALTVLKSCPLQDTIAILIILMQIPPIALSGIYMLFTLLTFVTASNGLSLSDVFEWNLGAPSLATVICVDGFVLLLWLFLPGPLQHGVLDFAQMVIALGLGGGSSSRDGGSWKNTWCCFIIILVSNLLRHTGIKYSPVGYLLGSSRFLTPEPDDPFESAESIRGYDRMRSGWVNWVRSILAIHILTQGVVKYIRDWYLRRERRDSLAQSVDPEAGKPYAGDFSNDGGFSTPDSDAASLQPPTVLNSKKKRKQSAQIRNRQPLWAAIASTKIVVVKEYELTHSAVDSAASNATDIHNLGNAPFNTQPEQIWISYVGCDEVCFNTSHFAGQAGPGSHSDSTSGIDLSKPFYVRVNNAVWQPTRFTPVMEDEDSPGNEMRWSGDIYGLTPMSNYECEFVSTATHEVLFSTSVRTTQARTADVDVTAATVAAAASKPNGQRSLRPDSPATTLKTSIAAGEVKLAEEKSRHKAMRKEWHRKANAVKKENERLSAAVLSAGAGDDKLRQKIQQNTTQQKQAEQAMDGLETQVKELETIPESLKAEWKLTQSCFNSDKAKYDKAHAEFKSFKATMDGRVKALADEKASLEAKRNKISSRIAKVDGEHARIADANARGLDEAERRRQDSENLKARFVQNERDLLERINTTEARLIEKEQMIGQIKSQLEAYHSQPSAFYNAAFHDFADAPLPPMTTPSVVNTAPYDATTAWNNSAYNASLWGPSPLAPGFVPQSSSLAQLQTTFKPRGRSSSMLSDVSGFTQSSVNDDELSTTVPVPLPVPASFLQGPAVSCRPPPGFDFSSCPKIAGEDSSTGSEGRSGSGSEGSESLEDPKSPVPV